MYAKRTHDMQQTKKRHVVSYEKMSHELAEAFAEKYPKGFTSYLADLEKYTKPDGTPFYAVTMEMGEDIYLVKIQIETDDLDDVNKWLNDEDVSDVEEVGGGASGAGDSTLPDDNISQYGADSDDDSAA